MKTAITEFSELFSTEFFNKAIQSTFSGEKLNKEEIEKLERLRYLSGEIFDTELLNCQRDALLMHQALEDDDCGYFEQSDISSWSVHQHEKLKLVREMSDINRQIVTVTTFYEKGEV